MSAATHADVLFVKNKPDNDLGRYCDRKGYPYKLFKDWTQIKADVEQIIKGEAQPKEIMTDLGKTTGKTPAQLEEEAKKPLA